jgi:hypothetical protein
MPRQCVFYLRGYRQYCEVMKALGGGPIDGGKKEFLQQSYCSTPRFMDCPLFRQLERSLASAHLRLDLPSAV